jgi:AcrR family transcriptional regulator
MGPISTPPTASTRDAILDAAGLLLGRFGYHKTTMDDLAREAGIARRTLYLHFRCKDDIFLARIDRVIERLLSEERQIAASGGSASERIERLLRRRVIYRLDVVKEYAGNLDEVFAALRKPYLERRASWFAAETAILARVLAEGRERGELACADLDGTARALVAATNSLLPYALSSRDLGSRRDLERTLDRVIALLLGGIAVEAKARA